MIDGNEDTTMWRTTSLAVTFGLIATLAVAQTPPPPPRPPAPPAAPALPAAPFPAPDLNLKLDRLGPALEQLRPALDSLARLKDADMLALMLDDKAANFDALIADFDADLALADPQAAVAAVKAQRFAVPSSETVEYDRGTSYLDSGRYDRALEAFDKVIAGNGPKTDGAMYWKAYSLNKLGKRTEALAVIDGLVKKFPSSRWAADAKALRIDVQQAIGQPVRPEQTSDEDLKMIALNSVVRSDPDRGIPMVEQILNSSASPRLKERALFVLAQSASPRAKTLLAEFARGSKGNPDLQLKALDYLGAFRGGPDVKLLLDVYRSTNDVDVKRRVIRSLGMAGRRGIGFGYGLGPGFGGDGLFEAYKQATETYSHAMDEARAALDRAKIDIDKSAASQDQNERARAEIEKAKTQIERQRAVGVEGDKTREARAKEAGDALWQLYQSEPSIDLKRDILRNLRFTSETDHLLQIARTETNPLLRQAAIQGLIFDRTPQSTEMMLSLYKTEKDPAVRRQIIDNVSAMHGSAATLVQMARQETDPTLRKRIVERLSTMKDKEAVDYMMEILKK
jgi:tetratricopeptide (TPR) repeat protein